MSDDILKMSVDRGFTWMEDETLALIKIWGSKEIQIELNTAKRNFSVYERIAKELSEVGYSRTAYQCREKIKRLRKEYQVAHYCVLHDVNQKKPMKYYELVDQVFNGNALSQSAESFDTMLYTDQQDSNSQFLYNQQEMSNMDSDDNAVLPILSTDDQNNLDVSTNLSNCSNDSNETVVETNSKIDEQENDKLISDKENSLDDDDVISPWVPNVVLVENDSENKEFDFNCNSTSFSDIAGESNSTMHKKIRDLKESSADDEPARKKRKTDDGRESWFKSLLDKVTEKFISYQESADSRLLDNMVLLEKERIKKDEAMQKLWIEFEERRQRQSQQHELKMLNLFSQFLNEL